MDQKEFKLFYKNKSPLLYTYLLKEVVSAKVSEELMGNIFARFYRVRNHKPETISREKWLLLITKKFLVDYFTWRTTDEGQLLPDPGITSYESSHLAVSHQTQLTEWHQAFSEEEQAVIQQAILNELPPADVRYSLKNSVQEKMKDIAERYSKGQFKKPEDKVTPKEEVNKDERKK